MARLSPDTIERARDLISLYPEPRSALIPMLHLAQEQDGWVSEDAMEHIGELLDLTAADVLGTCSFYTMFKREPVGKHLISVCTNIACLLNGGYELLEHAEERLGVTAGATTRDGAFTLEEVECLADCGRAPCLQVNYRFFGNVDNASFDKLVDDLAAGRLDDEVPPHGTLSRVRRSFALTAPSSSAGSATGSDSLAETTRGSDSLSASVNVRSPDPSSSPQNTPQAVSVAPPGTPRTGTPAPGTGSRGGTPEAQPADKRDVDRAATDAPATDEKDEKK